MKLRAHPKLARALYVLALVLLPGAWLTLPLAWWLNHRRAVFSTVAARPGKEPQPPAPEK